MTTVPSLSLAEHRMSQHKGLIKNYGTEHASVYHLNDLNNSSMSEEKP